VVFNSGSKLRKSRDTQEREMKLLNIPELFPIEKAKRYMRRFIRQLATHNANHILRGF
jgi:hypothetical protein